MLGENEVVLHSLDLYTYIMVSVGVTLKPEVNNSNLGGAKRGNIKQDPGRKQA